jgi:hypothetical protein
MGQHTEWHKQHFSATEKNAEKVVALEGEMCVVKKVSGWVLAPVIGAIVLAVLGLVLKVGAK